MGKRKQAGEQPPDDTSCREWLARKRRFCTQPRICGSDRCNHHQPAEEHQLVECPLCGDRMRHDGKRLKKHMNKCNAAKKADYTGCEFFSQDLNAGSGSDDDAAPDQKSVNAEPSRAGAGGTLTKLTPEELEELCGRVRRVYSEWIGELGEDRTEDPALAEAVWAHEQAYEGAAAERPSEGASPEASSSRKLGRKALKHGSQSIQIATQLKRAGLLGGQFCYVEFGAGKGGLSHTIAAATNDSALHILIDCGTVRCKDDRFHRREGYSRHRIDIKHLKLAGFKNQMDSRAVVGVGKHLCGQATDYALRSLIDLNQSSLRVAGAAIALCCHHRCGWHSYTGKGWLTSVGFSRADFEYLRCMSSWAVCGERPQQETEGATQGSEGASRRVELGLQVKRVLDMGRVQYLKQHGLDASLLLYCHPSKDHGSLENCLIRVQNKQSPCTKHKAA
eukprot:TRINITY_DN7557_c0_g1_i2.p1 TRINITY_DN7557_c0_g1~~TRINITY_DN7557_c0_g1_i2.p1  ORF type:complete len:448 (+),score=93.05 TRINITY_DN7557_c0_g1_i2:232-1575(+)